MITANQRLARMRKSFAKNKSVLTSDYKYFTTPDKAATPHVSIRQNKVAHMSGGPSVPKSPKSS
jgi:hypothetical protein